MRSHLKFVLFATSLSLGLLQGCSRDNPLASNQEGQLSQEELAKRLPNQDQKSRAIKKAKEFLSSEGVLQTNAEWAASAVIVDAFPLYMDGVDDVSYYECKVKQGGQDAGYILVNINRTDVQYPSYCTEGKTATEEFSQELGTQTGSLQIFRHNWFEFLAERKSPIGLGNGDVAIERGFDGSGYFKKGNKVDRAKLKAKRQDFIGRVIAAGGVHPRFTRQLMNEYYMRDSVVQDSLSKLEASGGIPKLAASYRWSSDELNYTFATGWHLPKWTQVTNTLGMPSGCGPLGVAMMYAYHKQFRGRTLLYNGLNLNGSVHTQEFGLVNASSEQGSYNQIIRDVAFQIGADCGATYNTSGTGASLNQLENDGELYGDRFGYDVVLNRDYGGDFGKCRITLDHIRSERPVLVQIDSDGNGSIDHYIIVEGAKYCEKKDGWKTAWSWWDYEAWYLANYGWGHKREWICAEANYGSPTRETENDGNLYMWIN